MVYYDNVFDILDKLGAFDYRIIAYVGDYQKRAGVRLRRYRALSDKHLFVKLAVVGARRAHEHIIELRKVGVAAVDNNLYLASDA